MKRFRAMMPPKALRNAAQHEESRSREGKAEAFAQATGVIGATAGAATAAASWMGGSGMSGGTSPLAFFWGQSREMWPASPHW